MKREAVLFLALWLPAATALAFDPFDTESMVGSRAGMGGENCRELPADQPLGVGDVVDLALCRNPRTAQAWANARAQAAQVGVARAGYLPKLDATAGVAHNWNSPATATQPASYDSTSVGLTASYLLFDFGGRGATLENARQLLIASDATLESTVQSVFLNAASAFYQVQATSAALEAARSAEQTAQESFRAAQTRYEVGAGTPADRLQAQTAYSQATLNRITAEGNLRTAQGTLANVVGLDADQTLLITPAGEEVPTEAFSRKVHDLIEEARQYRPDLQAAEAQARAAQANVDVARASGRPTISVSGSMTRSDRQNFPAQDTSSVGLTLSVPLFAGYGPTYKVRAAEAQAQSAAAQRDQIRQQVALDVWNAYQNLNIATQSLATTADLLASAQQSADVALGRYKAGVGSILDLLNAQSALASARQQRIAAYFNWNTARVTLAQAMGTLDRTTLPTGAPGNRTEQQ